MGSSLKAEIVSMKSALKKNFRFHIQVIAYSICPSLSCLFHLAQCPAGSSMLSQRGGFPSFSRLNNIPLSILVVARGWEGEMGICRSNGTNFQL